MKMLFILNLGSDSKGHKVRKCKEYHSVCLLVGIGTRPTPLSPEPGGGGGGGAKGAGGG
jgi:hypothetical protein